MKKIAILGLHLNFGGVEQAIANQANILCNDYHVELAIIYKMNEKPVFEIDNRVKINYLTELKPNREKFKLHLKNRNFIKAFYEGLKSIKILYQKKQCMKEYIKNSDADIIIATRIEITELLNKYASKNKLTIAEEHCHHNNNQKYLKRLKKACTNINYLLGVSKSLTEDYKKLVGKEKSIYLPNCLDYIPKEGSKLETKNIISIGRLSPEKGCLDLIDVFKEITELDSTCKLHIVGDGAEYESVKEKIKTEDLNSKVEMHGFLTKKDIHKLLKKMSLYLMCSYEESFGIVLIEAGAFNIPTIAFDSAQGANEIIIDNKSGYLISNREKKEMAKKAVTLLNNKKQIKSFGKEAYKEAEKFSIENVGKLWLKFLKEVSK